MEKKSVIKKITGSREALLAIIVVVLFAVVTVISPSFLTPKSLMEMLKNNAVTMVMSLGMLCVMLVGGIDIPSCQLWHFQYVHRYALKYRRTYPQVHYLLSSLQWQSVLPTDTVVGLVISRANVPAIITNHGL